MWALKVDQEVGMKLLKDWVSEDTFETPEAPEPVMQAGEATIEVLPDINEVIRMLQPGETREVAEGLTITLAEKSGEKLFVGALRDHLEIEHGVAFDSTAGMSQADLKVTHGNLHAPDEGGGPGKEAPDHEEKAEFKPWHIAEKDGKYCCIKDSDGSEVDCHDTREEAAAHIRALYANAASDDSADEKFADLVATAAEAYDYGVKSGRALSTEREQAIRTAIEALTAILPVEGETLAADTEKSAEADEAQAELEEYKRKLDLLDM
jgi:hypothetical protein